MGTMIPEGCQLIEAISPVTDGGARTSDYISLKNAIEAFAIIHITQAAANPVVITAYQATTVAGGSEKILTTGDEFQIWSNLDCADDDSFTRRTDAVNYSTDAGVKHKIVIFRIDPKRLDVNNGFDCFGIRTSGASASNILSAQFLIKPRYADDDPPSAIID